MSIFRVSIMASFTGSDGFGGKFSYSQFPNFFLSFFGVFPNESCTSLNLILIAKKKEKYFKVPKCVKKQYIKWLFSDDDKNRRDQSKYRTMASFSKHPEFDINRSRTSLTSETVADDDEDPDMSLFTQPLTENVAAHSGNFPRAVGSLPSDQNVLGHMGIDVNKPPPPIPIQNLNISTPRAITGSASSSSFGQLSTNPLPGLVERWRNEWENRHSKNFRGTRNKQRQNPKKSTTPPKQHSPGRDRTASGQSPSKTTKQKASNTSLSRPTTPRSSPAAKKPSPKAEVVYSQDQPNIRKKSSDSSQFLPTKSSSAGAAGVIPKSPSSSSMKKGKSGSGTWQNRNRNTYGSNKRVNWIDRPVSAKWVIVIYVPTSQLNNLISTKWGAR